MRPDAPVLHDESSPQGVDPKPTRPSNVAKRITFTKGDVGAGLARGRGHDRAPLYEPAGASGLYRAACLRRLGRRRRPVHDLEFEPGPVHGARLLRQAARHRHGQYPRDPGRDRRRVRRQDARLSGAGRAGAVEENRPAGQDGDEPRGGVPRHRPGRRRRLRGQARRQEGRPAGRGRTRRQAPGRRLPGLAGRAGLHVRLRDVRHPARQDRRLRCRVEPAQGRRLSRARRAELDVRHRELHGRAGPRTRASTRSSCARSTPPRTAPRRRTGRPGPISAIWRRVEAAKGARAPEDPLGPNQGRGIASGFWFNIGGESAATSTSTRTARPASSRATPISAARAPRWR